MDKFPHVSFTRRPFWGCCFNSKRKGERRRKEGAWGKIRHLGKNMALLGKEGNRWKRGRVEIKKGIFKGGKGREVRGWRRKSGGQSLVARGKRSAARGLQWGRPIMIFCQENLALNIRQQWVMICCQNRNIPLITLSWWQRTKWSSGEETIFKSI